MTPPKNKRLRDYGVKIGRFKPGRFNAITDVDKVLVGHTTLIRGEGAHAVRTGVTAILPNHDGVFMDSVIGGGFVLNGAGEISGLTQVLEWGVIETPILLTNTLSVGTCGAAVVDYMIAKYPTIGRQHDVVIPLVGECDDSWLNDIAGRHVKNEDAVAAIEAAQHGPVAEGSVGGGTGMITCDFKGGIGTSSRRLPNEMGAYTLGVLVMSNFGFRRDLRVDGVPVGRLLEPKYRELEARRENYGSIIAVVATNAPLLPHQLNRLAKRVALGIGRAGSFAAHGSGEIVLALSTANKVPREGKSDFYRLKAMRDELINPLYEAAIEATEESILNALFAAEDMTGFDGHFCPSLPIDDVLALMKAHRAL